MKKYYTIYETKNLIDGKKYIGKHVTENLDDGYLGSGIRLNNAINKYGRENFEKKVLFIFDNEDDMNNKEIELITDEILCDDMYYNLAYGGKGGCIVFKKSNPRYQEYTKIMKDIWTEEKRQLQSEMTKELHRHKKVGMYGRKQSKKQKEAVSKCQRGRKPTQESLDKRRETLKKLREDSNYVHPRKGKPLSEITRKKISKNHHDVSGNKNPMYGKKHKEETKRKIAERAKAQEKITCPHCEKNVDRLNYSKWHGEKCKLNSK